MAARSAPQPHEAAVQSRAVPNSQLFQEFNSIVGSLRHVVKYRPEISAAMDLLGCCLTFPTEELLRLLALMAERAPRSARRDPEAAGHRRDRRKQRERRVEEHEQRRQPHSQVVRAHRRASTEGDV